MVTRSHATSSSELHDLNNSSSLDRNNGNCHHPKGFKDLNLELGIWMFILPNLILEILVLRFDQMASPQEPENGLIVWGLCMAMMLVCSCELVYKGLIKEKLTLLQCLKSIFPCCSSNNNNNFRNPFSFMDGLVLAGAKIQTAFASISYAYLRQGKENYRIKVSFVSLIFFVFFVFAKLVVNKNRKVHVLPVRGGGDDN